MNPFSLWTEFAFKLWGFGKPAAPSSTPEKEVAVAVIPTKDAEPPSAAKAAHPHERSKRAKRNARRKSRAKRAGR